MYTTVGGTMNKTNYQVCATCIHFAISKTESGMLYRCSRLGFETKPAYSFQCWQPKEHVVRLMKKRGGSNNE
ncbi:hypothetical protein ABET51_07365 [Metabacillus fastidiosus]|uniref:hypothetical protein n=2 Tax=Metabacillus fastidiosus TaxID=1458 RepID=UPI003D2E6C87